MKVNEVTDEQMGRLAATLNEMFKGKYILICQRPGVDAAETLSSWDAETQSTVMAAFAVDLRRGGLLQRYVR